MSRWIPPLLIFLVVACANPSPGPVDTATPLELLDDLSVPATAEAHVLTPTAVPTATPTSAGMADLVYRSTTANNPPTTDGTDADGYAHAAHAYAYAVDVYIRYYTRSYPCSKDDYGRPDCSQGELLAAFITAHTASLAAMYAAEQASPHAAGRAAAQAASDAATEYRTADAERSGNAIAHALEMQAYAAAAVSAHAEAAATYAAAAATEYADDNQQGMADEYELFADWYQALAEAY